MIALKPLGHTAPTPTETPGEDAAERTLPREDRRRGFLRRVSHELRTPLNSVIGFSEVISREIHGPLGDPRYRQYAEMVRESGLRLLKLANQVLEIARLQSGDAELHIGAESAPSVVQSALSAVDAEAEARGIAFRVDIDPATPLVIADPRALETVLTNLLQNAVFFSPKDGEVHIQVGPVANGVLFAIRDHGEGVPRADIPRLMAPFEQGENALTRRSEGVGLGLPIARLLCSEMGGQLRLRSQPGEGLTALVRLHAALPEDGGESRLVV